MRNLKSLFQKTYYILLKLRRSIRYKADRYLKGRKPIYDGMSRIIHQGIGKGKQPKLAGVVVTCSGLLSEAEVCNPI